MGSLLFYRNRAERNDWNGWSNYADKSQKKNSGRTDKPKVDWKALDIVHPNAAGVDIGGSEHWVAISPERDPEPVHCFMADLQQMADWLIERRVRSVAMQSTGVHWIPVFEIPQ